MIRERRLYGFMLQEHAESAVGARDRIEKTIEDVIAEATAKTVDERSANTPVVEPSRLVDIAIGVVVRASARNHPPQPIGTPVRHLLIKR